MSSTERLTSAAEAYVARALELLRERCPAEGDTALELGFARWREDTQGEGTIARFGSHKIFRLTPDVWEPARVCAVRELARLPDEGMREYRELVDAMEADPTIGERLGEEVVGGAGLGGGPMQPTAVTQDLVLQLVEQSEGFDPVPELVGQTIDRWVAHLRRDRETVIVLAPLAECAVASPPVQVADGVTIVELTSDEIGAMLMFGSWPISDFERRMTFMSQLAPSEMVEPTFAIRSSYSAPVVRGGGTPEQIEATVSAAQEAAGVAEDVLLALRLFKPGRVWLRGIVSVTPQPFGGLWPSSGIRSQHARRLRGDTYALAADDGPGIAELYRQLATARSNPLIDAAVRRFGYAADRLLADDEIVDLVIAAESLFLGELEPPHERGEMVYRLANRAASFADGDGQTRRVVLRFMKNAYGARSGIVHSGRLDEAKLRDLDGQRATPARFADDLEELIRRSLRKAVHSVASGTRFPPNWDELLFP
jgi:hypothetical protein